MTDVMFIKVIFFVTLPVTCQASSQWSREFETQQEYHVRCHTSLYTNNAFNRCDHELPICSADANRCMSALL